jgi:hypothetical protein
MALMTLGEESEIKRKERGRRRRGGGEGEEEQVKRVKGIEPIL